MSFGLRLGNVNNGGIVFLDDLSDLISDFESELNPETDRCQIRIVESIPEGLTYNGSDPEHLSTYQVKTDPSILSHSNRKYFQGKLNIAGNK